MGYHHLAVDDIEPTPDRPSVQRSISDAAGLENAAVNVYEVAPGEDIPLAYHYHDDQEELFYVLSGTLAVETPEQTYEVSEDEVFVVEPDSPQRAHNPESAAEPVRTIVVGAPAVDDVHPYDPE
ncbi:cupin domain-containing protein [Haloarcula hispanica]|uniref:Cupin domain-containing protein n=1 Tax=Haloarcula hispanica TaxID=51589 RepID=A0A482T6R2_HALHI|nr:MULTISPECIES: cupin domain-containing protein [Haloarcula]AJF25578.1 cupin [Haloarcula sp. CBA1115]KAA9408329.1 cupin domain-containing protein [Haloarcula hispanica]KZX46902.1 cupin [Haloarcula sp. K1]MCJ0620309.1 cupin domain-containing protein [Haloarcula hispanica]RYJ10720.1 cupin domain-containing protein [Haloarcula hispanica]